MMRLKENEKAARRLSWCKATTLIAVVAPLALLALSTPLQADTEAEFQQTLGDETGGIEGLAYDYVFGKVSKEQFEDALIDAGGDIIVGLFDLGVPLWASLASEPPSNQSLTCSPMARAQTRQLKD